MDRTKRVISSINPRLVYFLISTLILILAGNLVILFARGYNFDFQNRSFTKTGIISVRSIPEQASVYINGQLATATNNNIDNLTPGKYQVRVTKDGYTPWEKEVEVKQEVVTPIEIVLFPSVPDLNPITFNGVNNPKFSPDQNKLVYAISNGDKTGLWVLDLSDRPLIFSRDPKQIVKDANGFNFSQGDFSWTPDSKSVVVRLKDRPNVYLLSADQTNRDPFNDITASVATTETTWQEEERTEEKQRISKLPEMGRQIATASARLKFSPDEKRFIAFQKDGEKEKAVVYDSRPSPDPSVKETTFNLPEAKEYLWLSDSQHIVLVEEGSISIIEKDGTNKSTVYSGVFENSLVFPVNNGTRLLILANFNSAQGKHPNLYSINLR